MNVVPESARHLQMTRTRIPCVDTRDLPEAQPRGFKGQGAVQLVQKRLLSFPRSREKILRQMPGSETRKEF